MSTRTRRGIIILILLITPFIVGLLFTYEIIKIPFPTDLEYSPAVDYQEGPRLSPPEGAIPIQGQKIIPNEFPHNPIPSDETSLQRGEILYDLHCALCHGEFGQGDGPLAQYYSRTPENLVGPRASAEFDGSVFIIIHQGFGEMPSLNENLIARETWDVINFIRTLPTEAE